jgi:hypothetical protein
MSLSTLILASIVLSGNAQNPVPVKLVFEKGKYQLLRGGKPYFIKGAGGARDEQGLQRLKEAGGNSVRTWGADNLGPLLDMAHARGLTVTVGIWLGHKRHGFDWTDKTQVQKQFESTREWVRQYRNHPAVLMWALGNEMENGDNTPELWRAINDLALMVKKEDPRHPVLTVTADMSKEKADYIDRYAPALDLLGINSYGGLTTLSKRLSEFGVKRPYVVTEFGPVGQWEAPKTDWGVPFEPTSTAKGALYAANYSYILADPDRCLGSYVFLWGNKQEETSTWFGMYLPTGEKVASVDEMTRLWSGQYPRNRAPEVRNLTLAGADGATPSAELQASVDATDPDGDSLQFEWEVRSESTDKRSGGDLEAVPPKVEGSVGDAAHRTARVKVPKEPGQYRLFLIVRDGKGGAATGNVPFMVKKQ